MICMPTFLSLESTSEFGKCNRSWEKKKGKQFNVNCRYKRCGKRKRPEECQNISQNLWWGPIDLNKPMPFYGNILSLPSPSTMYWTHVYARFWDTCLLIKYRNPCLCVQLVWLRFLGSSCERYIDFHAVVSAAVSQLWISCLCVSITYLL